MMQPYPYPPLDEMDMLIMDARRHNLIDTETCSRLMIENTRKRALAAMPSAQQGAAQQAG